MPTRTPSIEHYNELGRYVQQERGDRSLAEIARRGGIDPSRLGRWLRDHTSRLAPSDVLEAIAVGLGRPPVVIQTIAMRQANMSPRIPAMNDEKLHVVDAMDRIDEHWQRALRDVVLRFVDEIEHAEDLAGQQ